MKELITRLFPICRSITGDGVRETLKIIGEYIPLEIHEVSSGTQVFDWVVPKEWNIKSAYITDSQGKVIVDFANNNLHIVNYSTPVNTFITLPELQEHLYSIPEQPDVIPYITSYYERRWGFCLSHNQRTQLKDDLYHVVINSELKDGSLTYGECIIKGKSVKSILLSVYTCHPSLANDGLSAPAVATFIAKWLASQPRQYTYKIVFIPETIGSLTYLSKNLWSLQRTLIAGFVIFDVGAGEGYYLIASRKGNTLADRVAQNILRFKQGFKSYSFLHRGGDERQYCAPGIDLPVVRFTRSTSTYPEYHTSLDNLSFISSATLQESYEVVKDCIELLENNKVYQTTTLGEPQLGRRGLYPTLGSTTIPESTQIISDFLAYADGESDIIDISNTIGIPCNKLYSVIEKLKYHKLIREIRCYSRNYGTG